MNLANRVNRFNFEADNYKFLAYQVFKKRRYDPFVRAFNPTLVGGRMYINKLPVLLKSEVPRIVAFARLRTGAPMGIESLHRWISTKVALGVSRRHLEEILKKDPMFENLQRRGDRHVSGRKYKKEGLTRRIFQKHPHALATDLIQIGDKMFSSTRYRGKYKFILVVVHKYSGYTWATLMRNKKPKTIATNITPILENAKRRFGPPGIIERDQGKEYSSEYQEVLKRLDIADKPQRKAYAVETRNSLLQRSMVELEKQYPITKNLDVSLEKINNTPNRTIGGATPLEVYKKPENMKKDFPKKYQKYTGDGKTNRTRSFKVGQKVRYLLKKAQREDAVGYKSYTKHYSANTETVKSRRGNRYRISNVPYVLKPDELISAEAELKPLSSELLEKDKKLNKRT